MGGKGFRSFQDYILDVDESIYKEIDSYIQILDGIRRLSQECIYLVDFYKGKVLYQSDIPIMLCGLENNIYSADENYRSQFVSEEEDMIIAEILKSWFSFLMKKDIEERKSYYLNYHYHLNNQLICLNMTPVFLSKDGKPWLMLCNVKLSTNSKFDYATIYKFNSSCCWSYSLSGKWIEGKQILLKEIEKQIIILSLRGKREEEIGEIIFRSKDGVKSIKRQLFRKLRVRNITEAVSYAISHGLVNI